MLKSLGQSVLISFTAIFLSACGGGGGGAPSKASGFEAPAKRAQAADEEGGLPEGYRLVWADEFNGSGLPNSSIWSYDTEMNRAGWYHGELQYYAAGRLANSQVSDGKLIITARKEALTTAADYGGQAYTSARLITRGKASWTYGFFEIRAKLPCGVGTWPAIWMMGVNENEAVWPANGEIDIMEQVGKLPTEINATLHMTATAGTAGITGMTHVNDACTAFHNYQLTWTEDALLFGVDDRIYHVYRNPKNGKDSWPYDSPQYLLLNLAIGGEMAGFEVDEGALPRRMEVEYVRVYQKE